MPLWLEQLKAIGVTLALSVRGTAVIAFAIKAVLGLRPSLDDEEQGLDISEHGEAGHHLEDRGAHSEVEPLGASIHPITAPLEGSREGA